MSMSTKDDFAGLDRPEKMLEQAPLEELWEKSQPFLRQMTYYRCALMEVETKFNVLNEEFSLTHDRNPISSIKCRLKSLISIRNKLVKKGLPLTLTSLREELNDIAGIRVCCAFVDDVYRLAESLLRQDDVTLIETKDYIRNPKPNGYRSLHLIVSIPIFLADETQDIRVEIQLRTIAMDSWASLEHQLRYKKETEFTEEMANELLRCAELSAELDSKMAALQQYAFAEE